MSALSYFAHSLYQPNSFIVPGFSPGMPTINKPPVGLTDDEIKAVIAFLQSLGGTPTITMDTQLVDDKGNIIVDSVGAGGESAPAATAAAPAPAPGGAGAPPAEKGRG